MWPRGILQLTLERCEEKFINALSKVAVLFPQHPCHILTVVCVARHHMLPLQPASHVNRSTREVLSSLTDFKSQVLPNQRWLLSSQFLAYRKLSGNTRHSTLLDIVRISSINTLQPADKPQKRKVKKSCWQTGRTYLIFKSKSSRTTATKLWELGANFPGVSQHVQGYVAQWLACSVPSISRWSLLCNPTHTTVMACHGLNPS